MVRSGGYGRDPVCTSREAIGDISSELALDCNTVETLEESKGTWVCGLRRVEGWNLFNDDVVVSDDLPSVVQLLGCSKVRCGGISEVTGLHPLCIQDNSERGVGVNVTAVGRELKLAGGHVVNARNITHRCRVARASLNLETICDGLADTEVDEVVGADEGICFTRPVGSTVDLLNDRRVQSEGSLRVPVSITAILVVVSVVLVVVCGGGAVVGGGGAVVVVGGAVVAAVIIVATVFVVATFQTISATVAAEFGVLTGQEAM